MYNSSRFIAMKKRTIIATIAVALIAGVSIFAACTKEENKETHPFAQNKDYVEYFTDGTVVLATYQIGSTLNPVFNFNYDYFVSKLEDTCSTIAGCDVMLEDMQIIDDSVRKESWQAILKISLYSPALEDGASYYIVLNKKFDMTLSGDDVIDTMVYYTTPNGDGNEPVIICKQGTCTGTCNRVETRNDNGKVTELRCDCIGGSAPDPESSTGHCEQDVVFNNGTGGGGTNFWTTTFPNILSTLANLAITIWGHSN